MTGLNKVTKFYRCAPAIQGQIKELRIFVSNLSTENELSLTKANKRTWVFMLG